jgi:hypothetical protein
MLTLTTILRFYARRPALQVDEEQSVIECSSEDNLMNITIEAVYEAGVFKPLSPVENLK